MGMMEGPLARLFLILWSAVLCAATTCPQSFSFEGGHCIYFSTHSKTYCDAQRSCHSMGGELAIGEWITQLPYHAFVKTDYFIGASDLLDDTSSFPKWKRKTSFRWTDGSFAQDKFFSEFIIYWVSAEWKTHIERPNYNTK